METKNYFEKSTQLFENKYGIEEATSRSLSHRNYEVYKALCSGETSFAYKKNNGEIRIARGTLVPSMFEGNIPAGVRTPSFDNQVYFDTEKHGFRSFKKSNLIGLV